MESGAANSTEAAEGGYCDGHPGGWFGHHIGIAQEKEDEEEADYSHGEAGVFDIGEGFVHGETIPD